nr:unnamed protein product [Callosobruchus chinensis]
MADRKAQARNRLTRVEKTVYFLYTTSKAQVLDIFIFQFFQTSTRNSVPHGNWSTHCIRAFSFFYLPHKKLTGTVFPRELLALKQGKALSKSSKILSLNPFIDDAGVIRVGGRIQRSEYQFSFKHPAILAGKHHLSILLCQYEHKRLLHAGPQQTLYSLGKGIGSLEAEILLDNHTLLHKVFSL